ncbi:hypothetical protein CEXT_584491 [Caerostris extrusa]|uniref:Uncharacterized protein n=1 Tax=Caerostris extrusa TaxID=172846 RepID=A0AAV4U6Y2_CAEEX|nr:hypothetical protein CEXT_584491 [Caerostris extrusa]
MVGKKQLERTHNYNHMPSSPNNSEICCNLIDDRVERVALEQWAMRLLYETITPSDTDEWYSGLSAPISELKLQMKNGPSFQWNILLCSPSLPLDSYREGVTAGRNAAKVFSDVYYFGLGIKLGTIRT